MSRFDRITQRPDVMGGKACIRGMRVTVGMILGQIAQRPQRRSISPTTLRRRKLVQALLRRTGALRSGKASSPR